MIKLVIHYDEMLIDSSVILNIVQNFHIQPHTEIKSPAAKVVIADGRKSQNTRLEILIFEKDLESIDNLKMVFGFDYVMYQYVDNGFWIA